MKVSLQISESWSGLVFQLNRLKQSPLSKKFYACHLNNDWPGANAKYSLFKTTLKNAIFAAQRFTVFFVALWTLWTSQISTFRNSVCCWNSQELCFICSGRHFTYWKVVCFINFAEIKRGSLAFNFGCWTLPSLYFDLSVCWVGGS